MQKAESFHTGYHPYLYAQIVHILLTICEEMLVEQGPRMQFQVWSLTLYQLSYQGGFTDCCHNSTEEAGLP
jgi:hypothetical protein